VTITYSLHRTEGEEQNFLDHIIHSLIFLGKQIGILIPFFLMLLFLASKFKNKISFKDDKLLFLIAINILPIILVFLTSMIMGVKIRTMWMTPFYLFFGVFVLYIFQSQINLNKLKNFGSVFLILFLLPPFTYAYVSITETDKRTDYLGKEIAKATEKVWKLNSKELINYVGSDEWHAGNLSYNLKSRPKVVITSEVNSKISYYPHILLIFDYSSKKTCPETVWQLREDKISINNKKYLICY
jgi:hypothetical protein